MAAVKHSCSRPPRAEGVRLRAEPLLRHGSVLCAWSMALRQYRRRRVMRRPRRRFGSFRSSRRIARYSRSALSYRLDRVRVSPTLLSSLPSRPEVKRSGWSDASTTLTLPNVSNTGFDSYPEQFATGQTWTLFFDDGALAGALGDGYGNPIVQGPPVWPGIAQSTALNDRIGDRVTFLATRLRLSVSRLSAAAPGAGTYGTAPAKFWVALVKRKDGLIDNTVDVVGQLVDWRAVAAVGTNPVALWPPVDLPFTPNTYDVLYKKECRIDPRSGGGSGTAGVDLVEFSPIDVDLLIHWGAGGTEATFQTTYDEAGTATASDYPLFVRGNFQACQLVVFGNMDMGLGIANPTWNGVQANAAVTCEHYYVDP